MEIKRHGCETRMSRAVAYGGFVFLSALAAPGLVDAAAVQTANILRQIDVALAEAGSSRNHIVQAMIWLADIGDYATMNQVWDDWVPQGCAPARACAETRFSIPGILVEISVIAAQPPVAGSG